MIIKRPPMGFNTWNTFGDGYNEEVLKECADAMVDRGFLKAGYEYLVSDDFWNMEYRDPETGRMIPRPGKFPNGIVPVIDYIHSKGLKYGIYTCAGIRTCGGKEGSFDHEFTDARTFAEWGVDYVKNDFCLKPELMDGETLFRRMSIALRSTGRDMVHSVCNWGQDNVWSWVRSAGGHMYRTTGDIYDSYSMIKTIYSSQVTKLGAAATGCYNDLDMLTIGMNGQGATAGGDGCTMGTYKIQFGMWCMSGAPLIMGCDVRNVSDEYRDLLCNEELLKIQRDPECRPVFPIAVDDRLEFFKLLSDGDYAVMYINENDGVNNMCLRPWDIGLTSTSGYKLVLTDIFNGEEFSGTDFITFPVEPKDCRIFRGKLVRK